MSDHDKLREAIKAVRQTWCPVAATAEGLAEVVARAPSIGVPWERLQLILAAAESTLPKTKMAEVWRVEWAHPMPMPEGAQSCPWKPYAAQYPTEAEARQKADAAEGCGNRCIRVTGPHLQEIPA